MQLLLMHALQNQPESIFLLAEKFLQQCDVFQ